MALSPGPGVPSTFQSLGCTCPCIHVCNGRMRSGFDMCTTVNCVSTIVALHTSEMLISSSSGFETVMRTADAFHLTYANCILAFWHVFCGAVLGQGLGAYNCMRSARSHPLFSVSWCHICLICSIGIRSEMESSNSGYLRTPRHHVGHRSIQADMIGHWRRKHKEDKTVHMHGSGHWSGHRRGHQSMHTLTISCQWAA